MKNSARISSMVALFLAFTPVAVEAGTVTFDGTGTRPLWLAVSGPPVPVGDRVMVGYFAGLTDAQIEGDQADTAFLESTFVAFGPGGAVGDGTAPPGEPPVAGRLTFVTTATVQPPNPAFIEPSPPNNQQVYIWTFDSTSLPTAADHQAIFTSGLSNWRWPTTDDGSTDAAISLDDSLNVLVGGADAQAVFMQAIPEPAPWTLFGLGILGLALARRRIGVSAYRSGLPAKHAKHAKNGRVDGQCLLMVHRSLSGRLSPNRDRSAIPARNAEWYLRPLPVAARCQRLLHAFP